jgi:branched-chain amino acid transport system permease protein
MVTSKFGRAWLATSEDELVASTMGVNTRYATVTGFAIGCGYAGAAGSLFAVYLTAISPSNFTLGESCLMLVMVIVGGIADLNGSLIGAGTMLVAVEMFRPLFRYRLIILGSIMVVVLIFMPDGMIGIAKRSAKWLRRISKNAKLYSRISG